MTMYLILKTCSLNDMLGNMYTLITSLKIIKVKICRLQTRTPNRASEIQDTGKRSYYICALHVNVIVIYIYKVSIAIERILNMFNRKIIKMSFIFEIVGFKNDNFRKLQVMHLLLSQWFSDFPKKRKNIIFSYGKFY